MALLQGNQGQTGKQVGPNLTSGFGEYSDLLITELQARYYQNAYRGFVFSTANSGAQALSVNSATFTGLALANPAGGKFNLVLLDVSVAVAAAVTAVSTIVLGSAATVALTAGTALGPNSTNIGSGVNASAKVGASATLGAAPVVIRPLLGFHWVTAGTPTAQISASWDCAGQVIIPPGQLVCVEALVAAVTVVASMTWVEVPV